MQLSICGGEGTLSKCNIGLTSDPIFNFWAGWYIAQVKCYSDPNSNLEFFWYPFTTGITCSNYASCSPCFLGGEEEGYIAQQYWLISLSPTFVQSCSVSHLQLHPDKLAPLRIQLISTAVAETALLKSYGSQDALLITIQVS